VGLRRAELNDGLSDASEYFVTEPSIYTQVHGHTRNHILAAPGFLPHTHAYAPSIRILRTYRRLRRHLIRLIMKT